MAKPKRSKAGGKGKQAKRPAPRKVSAIPAGFHAVTPYLTMSDGARALEFYGKAFGAKVRMRMDAPGGRIGHAEIKIGDSVIMLADEHPEMDARSPTHFGGSPVSIMIYVEDVDKQFKQALAAGGTELRPLTDQFYGDRSGTLKDPFGHSWHLSTHKEDVSMEEMNRRMAAMKK